MDETPFRDCACTGKNLTRLLRPAILGVLARGPAHGYAIMEAFLELNIFPEGQPDHTGVYRLLKTMEEEGLVSSNWDLADSGPARRPFVLTEQGHECMTEWHETLERYMSGINRIMDLLQSGSSEGPVSGAVKKCCCEGKKKSSK
jgi:DNA-binding PadR family transcriptional regulator